jgi:hypothetical protein
MGGATDKGGISDDRAACGDPDNCLQGQ